MVTLEEKKQAVRVNCDLHKRRTLTDHINNHFIIIEKIWASDCIWINNWHNDMHMIAYCFC